MDVRAQMLVFFFSRILSTLTEVLGRDIRVNDPRMSAGCLSRKLPLWADFQTLEKLPSVPKLSRNQFVLNVLAVKITLRRQKLIPPEAPGITRNYGTEILQLRQPELRRPKIIPRQFL